MGVWVDITCLCYQADCQRFISLQVLMVNGARVAQANKYNETPLEKCRRHLSIALKGLSLHKSHAIVEWRITRLQSLCTRLLLREVVKA